MAAASVSSGTPRGRRRAEPGPQVVPEGDQADDRHGDRAEQVRQHAGEVAGDGAGPGGLAQGGGLVADPGDAVLHELGEEGVEVGEVPVQDALGQPASVVTARLVSAFGPSRSRMRSAAANSCSRASRMATPVGTAPSFATRETD